MAMIFNGVDQYGHLPTESLWNSSGIYSYAVWLKPDTGATTEQHVFGGFNATTLNHFSGTVYRADQATKTLSKYKSSSTIYYGASASYVPTPNAWNLHFFSRNGTGTSAVASRYFVNNSATGANTTDEQTSTNINKWGFGARRVAAGTYQNFFKGKIGCAAIWNRVLTIAEEDSIKAGAHPNTIPSGLVDIFEFNGTGTPATSTSLNGRIVTWVGIPTQDTDSPFPTITSVGTSGAFKVGQTAIPITTSGMGALTSITVADAFTTINGTSITGSVGSYTFNLGNWVDDTTYPAIGNVTVTASDGTARTTNGTLNLPISWLSQTQMSAVTADNTYIGYYISLPDNCAIYYQNTNGLIISSEGGVTCNSAMSTTIWVHYIQSGGTKKTISYTLTVAEGGVVVSVIRNFRIAVGYGIGISI